jgi:hypothetical protein
MIPFIPKDYNQKIENIPQNSPTNAGEEEGKTEKKNEYQGIKPENMEQPMIIGTPVFLGNFSKYYYNRLYKRKQKTFTEREGDWVCKSCRNLNFAFRQECNRCKLPKNNDAKIIHNDKNSKEEKNDVKGGKDEKEKKEQKNNGKATKFNKHKKNCNNKKCDE